MVVTIPALTARETAELDRRLLEEFHLDIMMLMENAGRSLAVQARDLLGTLLGRRILVMAGKGNNGGGGMVAARHMYNWGAKVDVSLSEDLESLKEAPLKQLRTLEKTGVATLDDAPQMKKYDLIIDALLGYNQKGNPRGATASLVRLANNSGRPILCLDVPTGLNPDTGRASNPCVRGTRTLILGLPKKGLLMELALPYVGRLFLADIGVPLRVYHGFGLVEPIFADGNVVELLR